MQQEVSERKRAGQNIALLNFALNNVREAAFLIDENARFHFVNEESCRVLGYTRTELLGLSVPDIDPDFPMSRWINHWNTLKTQRSLLFESRHRTKDGRIFPVEINANYFEYDSQGYNLVLVHDITKRKRAEEALRKAKEEWERTFDALPELIASIDTQHRIIRANKAMADTLKLPPAACVGVHCYQVVHGLDAPPAYCPHQQVLQDRQTHTAEVFEKCLGGNFLITASPLFDMHANLFGSVHIARNIDDRKRFEEQLQHTAEAANAANRAKSEFLANISHEIRTPMNAILGFAEILEGKIADTQQRQYVSLIRASGKTLLRLINDILDLSKIEAGKLDLQYGAVNARLVCQEVAQIFSQKISEKGLDFVLEVDPELPQYLSLDEIRLRQILLNLIGNAVKFTETGRVTLRARAIENCRLNIEGNNTLRSSLFTLQFEIEDTGIGIPADQCDAIFGAFEQVHEQSRKYGGAGLGLAITKRLVEMMGGVISVTGAVGQGSTFTVRFPHVRRVEGSDHAAPPSALPLETLRFDPATILIVDDVPDNRLLLRSYLEEFGLTSIEAVNGQEAIDLATHAHPALILMDMRMPAINGYDATQAIKHTTTTQDIPVIAVTATAMKETVAKVLAVCDAYLSKPVEKAALVAELVKFLPHTFAPKYSAQETIARRTDEGCVDIAALDPETVRRLPEALRMLETTWLPQWQTFQAALIMDDVKNFAIGLVQFAREYQLQIVLDYAEQLGQHARSYDILGVRKGLAKFPGLVKQLTCLHV